MEEKSQHRRLLRPIQGEQGEPRWCGISEAQRGLQKEGPSHMVAAVRGQMRADTTIVSDNMEAMGLGHEKCCEGVDGIQFKVG